MREKQIEQYLKTIVNFNSGEAYKFKSTEVGVSDRIVVLSDGSTWFIELKALTGKLSERQKLFRERMFQLNQKYACFCSINDIDEWAKSCNLETIKKKR